MNDTNIPGQALSCEVASVVELEVSLDNGHVSLGPSSFGLCLSSISLGLVLFLELFQSAVRFDGIYKSHNKSSVLYWQNHFFCSIVNKYTEPKYICIIVIQYIMA